MVLPVANSHTTVPTVTGVPREPTVFGKSPDRAARSMGIQRCSEARATDVNRRRRCSPAPLASTAPERTRTHRLAARTVHTPVQPPAQEAWGYERGPSGMRSSRPPIRSNRNLLQRDDAPVGRRGLEPRSSGWEAPGIAPRVPLSGLRLEGATPGPAGTPTCTARAKSEIDSSPGPITRRVSIRAWGWLAGLVLVPASMPPPCKARRIESCRRGSIRRRGIGASSRCWTTRWSSQARQPLPRLSASATGYPGRRCAAARNRRRFRAASLQGPRT